MNNRVLFVDDEPNVLAAIRRTVRQHVEAETCEDPKRALEVLRRSGPFAVIVSDMRMPGMSGIEFLSQARAVAPDSIRIMLTGNADQQTAIDAVNEGQIFRFLTKPTDPEILRGVLSVGLRQYELITAEKDLLQETLNGSINVLSQVLSMARPEAFGRTDRLRSKALEIAARFDDVREWELSTALCLSLLGCVGLPSQLLEKSANKESLSSSERLEYLAHPAIAADLIKAIPRLEGVAEIVLYQHKNFDGSGFPADQRRGVELPLGARILRLVLAYDELRGQGWSDAAICETLKRKEGHFDPRVLEALEACLESSGTQSVLRLRVQDLEDGMVIQEDVRNSKGVLLICEGQAVTPAVRHHLVKFANSGALIGTLLVRVPPRAAKQSVA